MIIYVVCGEYGDYDSSDHWMVRGFISEADAEEFRQRCQDESNRLKKEYQAEHAIAWHPGSLARKPTPEGEALREAFRKKWNPESSVNQLDPDWPSHSDVGYVVDQLEVEGDLCI